jgi:predicted Fe-S protein YdhL (DUF1289 family)
MYVRITIWLLASMSVATLLFSQADAEQGRRGSVTAPRKKPAPSSPRNKGAKGAGAAAARTKAAELDHWNKMSPEERQRVLNNLPPDRRKRFEEKFETYNSLSPAEKQKLRQQYNAFRQLPPARQEMLRKLYKEFEQLPPARREQLRGEVQRLGRMSPADRRSRLSSPDFRTKYTLSEQRLMEGLVKNLVAAR